jgi:chromosome partitioning protein
MDEGKLIVIASQKGGTGKSTLATNLAAVAANKKEKVLLVDCDQQQSATKWYGLRENQLGENNRITLVEKSFRGMDVKSVWRDIAKFQEVYDLVIVDTPGEAAAFVNSLMKVADLVIIPMATGYYDFWGASDTVQKVLGLNEELETPIVARICLNQVSQTTSSRTTRSVAHEEIHQNQIPIFATTLGKREIYAQSADGIGVTERYEREVLNGEGKKVRLAHREMESLYKEIVDLLKGGVN